MFHVQQRQGQTQRFDVFRRDLPIAVGISDLGQLLRREDRAPQDPDLPDVDFHRRTWARAVPERERGARYWAGAARASGVPWAAEWEEA